MLKALSATELPQAANKSFHGMVTIKFLPRKVVRILLMLKLLPFIFSFFKYSSKTLQQVLDELTTSQDLKFVLSYICGDYGECFRFCIMFKL